MLALLLLVAGLEVSEGAAPYVVEPPSAAWKIEQDKRILRGPGDLQIQFDPAVERGKQSTLELLKAYVARAGAGELTHEPRVSERDGVETAVGTIFRPGEYRVFGVVARGGKAVTLTAATKESARLGELARAVRRVMATLTWGAPPKKR